MGSIYEGGNLKKVSTYKKFVEGSPASVSFCRMGRSVAC